MVKLPVFCALFASFILLGCDDTFNPNGPYKDRLVVYGIFNAQSDTQFVRVHRTYPQLGNAVLTDVPGAQVEVMQGTRTFPFRDTTITITQSPHNPGTIRAYVGYGLRPQAGETYVLNVTAPSTDRVTGRAVALFRGSLITQTNPQGDITVRVTVGSNARAYIVRMYLDYLRRIDSLTQIQERVEIPERVIGNTGVRIYPSPVSNEFESVGFSGGALSAIVSDLRSQFPGNSIRPVRTVFVLTQMDSVLYAYHSTVNGFPGSGTIRLDEPDFSNIEGGLGIFGMISQTTFLADTTGTP